MKVRDLTGALITAGVVIILLSGCAEDPVYFGEIESWRTTRIANLKKPRGWLSLAGLYRIRDGLNSIGSVDTADIRFPVPAPPVLGVFLLDSSLLTFRAQPGLPVLTEGGDLVGLDTIDVSVAPVFHYGSLYWTFLDRNGSIYLRLWDTLSPARENLHEIPHFEVDERWNLPATFIPTDSGAVILLDDVLGLRRPYPVAGRIFAQVADQPFELIALDGGPDELFIIFEDATTDTETYPAGRYLYIPRAGKEGKTQLDFNKAYNPPCAFTEYATCLLAPAENKLSFRVEAGEKTYAH